jgi:heme/copper-type cytochrome/quinol oxidase subunit 1
MEGPVESLGFFARAHDVPLQQLLDDLRTAAEETTNAASAPTTKWTADAIYRPFFAAGILVVLTLGAAWGAFQLARIAWHGSFTGVGLHDVNAHGHAQIFGWVGLFVMGFALQAFPRFKHTSLAYPRLAYATFPMMLIGIMARSSFEPMLLAHPWARLWGS